MSSFTVLGVLIVVVIVGILVMPTYKTMRLRREARGKILCRFQMVAGDIQYELCPHANGYVFRGYRSVEEAKGAKVKKDKLGSEIYILKRPQALEMGVGGNGSAPAAVMAQLMTDAEGDEIEEEAGGRVRTAVKVKKKGKTFDLSGRPHALYPVLIGNKPSFFSPQVSMPYAEFVEGCNQEVDSLAVALNEFHGDPIFIAAMTGAIQDEKVMRLMGWFSDVIDELTKQLQKVINPTLLYVLLGLAIVFGLASVAVGWTLRTEVMALKEVIASMLPSGVPPTP